MLALIAWSPILKMRPMPPPIRRAAYVLLIRLEHVAHRPGAVAQGARELQKSSLPFRAPRAGTWIKSQSTSGMECHTRANDLMNGRPRQGDALSFFRFEVNEQSPLLAQ